MKSTLSGLAPLFALAFVTTGPVLADDTFASRFQQMKHIGLLSNQHFGTFTVFSYTPSQYRGHIASLAKYERELAEHEEQRAEFDRKRREALGAAAQNAITQERNLHGANRPQPPLSPHITLHTVLSVGEDYLTLKPHDQPDEEVLIPIRHIRRVVRSIAETNAAITDATDDGAPAETKRATLRSAGE